MLLPGMRTCEGQRREEAWCVMIRYIPCQDCMHENVCKNKVELASYLNQVADIASDGSRPDYIRHVIECKNFHQKILNTKRLDER